MENIINKERTQASVVKKLKELGCLATKVRKTTSTWTNQDEQDLTNYFEQFKSTVGKYIRREDQLLFQLKYFVSYPPTL